jgi:hypothetical protein
MSAADWRKLDMLYNREGIEKTHVIDHFILDSDILGFEEFLKGLLFFTVWTSLIRSGLKVNKEGMHTG